MGETIKVTVWNEHRHEKHSEKVRVVYPQGIHTAVGEGLGEGFAVSYATLDDDEEHGLSEKRLNETDVLIWWGHMAHGEVKDEIVERVHKRVLQGMGLIVLHSAHFSKIFKRLMGTSCDLKWRETGDRERLWVTSPGHPILEGIGEYIELPAEEMYGEHFDIPQPDELLLVSWFEGGEVFRSGCTFLRGQGKIFYFRPGHETYPTYYNEQIRTVIRNAVRWAKPAAREYPYYGKYDAREAVSAKE
ncbi:MAG: glutamine amidotransferase [Paenibacillaceae bacterium]|jgi:trehalose utilization protein|nr:glutamine amidotransferase [Paenibacillaceae bacterium]